MHWLDRNLDEALQHFNAYLDVAAQLSALDPGRAYWHREVAYANSNIGSVLQERHDLRGALERFKACLAIERALLAAAPRDQDLEQSVAASHNAIGVVLKSLGRLSEALEQFRAEAVIRERLVALDGANANWRLRLSTSHSYIGDMLAAGGAHPGPSRATRSRSGSASNWSRGIRPIGGGSGSSRGIVSSSATRCSRSGDQAPPWRFWRLR